MFVIDRLLLALSAVIFPDPGMERVFIHAKIARCLSKRLLRLDREFDCAFLKFSGILWRFLQKNFPSYNAATGRIRISHLGKSGWRSKRCSTSCIAFLPNAIPF